MLFLFLIPYFIPWASIYVTQDLTSSNINISVWINDAHGNLANYATNKQNTNLINLICLIP